MNRKKWAAIAGGFCVVIAVGYAFALLFSGPSSSSKVEVKIDESKSYPVSSVVDGDTFKVRIAGRDITARLLGVNTPETVDPRKPAECFGHEASDETKFLLAGHSVRLAFSPSKEHRDRYGRYLLYTYRDDGLFLNEYLVQEGFAREYTVGKAYSLQLSFRKAQNEAQAARKGLWGVCRRPS